MIANLTQGNPVVRTVVYDPPYGTTEAPWDKNGAPTKEELKRMFKVHCREGSVSDSASVRFPLFHARHDLTAGYTLQTFYQVTDWEKGGLWWIFGGNTILGADIVAALLELAAVCPIRVTLR